MTTLCVDYNLAIGSPAKHSKRVWRKEWTMETAGRDPRATRILIVDDESTNLDVLCRALEAGDHQVLVAFNGALGFKLAVQEVPDLILLDVDMPDIDGFVLCRQFKQNPLTQDIPVLFLTGQDRVGDVVEGFAAGGADYMIKPFRTEEVLVRVKHHLERTRQIAELAAKNQELERHSRELAWANEILQEEVIRALDPDQ
jgi:DNA-binding response OmpR family regulator